MPNRRPPEVIPSTREKLREVQRAVREVAEQAGFPDPLGGSAQGFDRPAGQLSWR